MTLTYEKVTEYLSAYAVGALDAEEQKAVDEYFHLQEELHQKLIRAQAASTLLAQGIADAVMPIDAKERAMTRVQTENSQALSDVKPSVDESIQPDNDRPSRNNRTNHRGSLANKSIASPLMRKRLGNRPIVQRVDDRQLHVKQPSAVYKSQDSQSKKSQSEKNRAEQKQSTTPQSRRTKLNEPQRSDNKDRAKPDASSFFFGSLNMRSLVNATLAASVAALVLLGALSGQLYKQTGELTEQNSQVRIKNAELAAINAQIQSDRAALISDLTDLEIIYQENAVERLALNNEIQRLKNQIAISSERITLVGAASQATVMFGTDEAPGSQGTFFHRNEEGALVVHGLKPLPAEQTYQFWLVTESGEQVSAGLFAVNENVEPTWANLALPQGVPAYNIVGVSVEPATGSAAPTGPMLLESTIDGLEASL